MQQERILVNGANPERGKLQVSLIENKQTIGEKAGGRKAM